MCSFLTGRPRRTDKIKDNVANVARIATLIVEWEPLRPFAGLDLATEKEIKKGNPLDYPEQKKMFLEKWAEKEGNNATFEKLISVATEAGNQQLAHRLMDLTR